MGLDDGIAFSDILTPVGRLWAKNRAGLLQHFKELKAAGKDHCDCEACELAYEILSNKDYLNKKSVCIFGGDGWAYDIGFGGLDHVLASGEDVNVFVFEHRSVLETPAGRLQRRHRLEQVAQFAAAGKAIKKKEPCGYCHDL